MACSTITKNTDFTMMCVTHILWVTFVLSVGSASSTSVLKVPHSSELSSELSQALDLAEKNAVYNPSGEQGLTKINTVTTCEQ
jgi:hypothetical protein